MIRLASQDEPELHVAELDDVASVENRALQLHAVHAHAVRAVAVDDLVTAALDDVDLRVNAAHRRVVHRQVAIFSASDDEPLVEQRKARADGGPEDHHQSIRQLADGLARTTGNGRRLALGVEPGDRVFVDELEAVVAELEQVAVLEAPLPGHPATVDEAAVVAREVLHHPADAVLPEQRVLARNVPL